MTTPSTILPATPATALDARASRKLIGRVLAREIEIEILREKRADVLTARARTDHGDTVIVKTWRGRGVRAMVRQLVCASGAHHEWRALQRMREADIPAALPLGFATGGGLAPWQGIIMSDLGAWPRGSEFLGGLIHDDRVDEADQFEDRAIDITQRMFAAGVIDGDHTFMNFIAVEHAHPIRLDLELSRTGGAGASDQRQGEMLGRLIGSYYYLAHPHPDRVRSFAERVNDAIRPSQNALKHARRRIEAMAERQRREHGVAVNLKLPF